MKKYLLFYLLIIVFLGCKNNPKTKENSSSVIEKQEKYTISNDTIKVSVKTFGAELTSIQLKDKEYLWQADTTYWKHQSPNLFPIIGRLKDHEFYYKDSLYKMSFHGFAWKNNFNLIEKTQNSLIFDLVSSNKTKKQYPFDFKLQIKYVLKNNILNVHYIVENTDPKEDLYFSIGAHPAFNIPLEKGQHRNEYELVFDTDEMPTSRNKKSGLFVDSYTQYFDKPGVLQIKDTTFLRGALVFNPNPFTKATLVHKPTEKQLFTIHFKDFPYLGIWTQPNPKTPFIAIEPWFGVAENIHHNKDFTQKEGIQKLPANGVFKAKYSVEIH